MEGTKTATEELRALLDARGAKYHAADGEHIKMTCWPYDDGPMAWFAEYDDGTTRFEMGHRRFTPARAVEATLGRGECEVVYDGELWWKCSECGEGWRQESDRPGYCPQCGRKMVGA